MILKIIVITIVILLLAALAVLFAISHYLHKIQNVGKDNKELTLQDGTKLRRMSVLSEALHHLYLSKQAPNMHCAIYGVDPNKSDMMKFWEELCQHWPNFRSVPFKQNNIWYWKELELSKIDMSKHVKQMELKLEEENKSDEKTSEAVDQHMAQIIAFINKSELNRPFDKDRPHWEFTYVTLKGSQNRVFGYFRCHHAIGDGAVLLKVIADGFERAWPSEDNKFFGYAQKIMASGRSADIDTDLEKEATKKQNRATVLTTVSASSRGSTIKEITGMELWKQLPKLLRKEYDLVYNDPSVPTKSVFRRGELKREYELSLSPGMNVGKLKILSHHFSCNMNDLMLTLWLASMSKYLYKRAEKTELSKWKQIYGEDIYVGILTIMGGRSSSKVTNVESVEENDIVMVPLKLPLGEMEFKQRLTIVKEAITSFKKGPALKVWRESFRACYVQGGVELVVKTLEKLMDKCVASFSTLKAPVFPVALGNDGLIWRCCTALNPMFTPLSCTATSCAGVMTVSLVTDTNTMSMKQSKEIVDEIPLEITRVFNSLPDDNYRWF